MLSADPLRHDGRSRVVFVDHVARLSGGEIALLRLLPALSPYVDVHVILGEDGPLLQDIRDLGISAEVMPLPPQVRETRKQNVHPLGVSPTALLRVSLYVFRLNRRLRALRADLVHTNSLKAALYGGAAGRLARIPVIWHVRDRIAPDYLPRAAVRLVHGASRVLPAAVVANSQATLETLPHLARGRVLYNPVVPDAVEVPASVATRSARESIVVGIIGRLAPWKGQHVFLDAFAEVFKGSAVRGRVIGSAMFGEDRYADSLRARAANLGISAQIEFRGFRKDVWAELAELDVLVHSSVTPEPFGQVVLEGMAAGVTVVAAAAGGPAELITSGLNGLLTEPGNSAELAAALLRLDQDTALRIRLADSAKLRSREFTPERTAAQLIEIYREVLAAH